MIAIISCNQANEKKESTSDEKNQTENLTLTKDTLKTKAKEVYSQCYIGGYDILGEKLCFEDNGLFKFELIDPLDPNTIITGKYKKNGDTLIFTPGVKQNKLIVMNCQRKKSEKNKNILMLSDQNNKPLAFVSLNIRGKSYYTNKEGLIEIDKKLPKEIKVDILDISDRLWANPYQKQNYKIDLNCSEGNGNLTVVQLDISNDFKMPFEYETKFLKKEDKLYYISESGEVIDRYLRKDEFE